MKTKSNICGIERLFRRHRARSLSFRLSGGPSSVRCPVEMGIPASTAAPVDASPQNLVGLSLGLTLDHGPYPRVDEMKENRMLTRLNGFSHALNRRGRAKCSYSGAAQSPWSHSLIKFKDNFLRSCREVMVFALVIPYSSLAFGQDSGALDSVMAGQNGVVLTLSTAVSVALDANPTLAEIKARYQAAEAVPSQRGALPDPALSFQLMNFPTDTFRFNQEPMTQVSFGISQGIPYPGKRKLRTEAAAFEAEAVAAEVEETQLRLVRDVKGQWWELFYLDRALETVGSNLELMRDLVKNAESKYEQGQGLQADVLLAQVELSTLLDQLISLRGMRKGKEAALNALLNRPTNQPIALTKTVGEVFPDIEPEQGLLAMAEESRPILEAQRLRIEAAESRRDLALKDYYPDFQLRASYGFRGGVNPLNGIDRPDFASAGVTISLPIYTGPKQDKAHQQRVAEVYQSRMALDRQRAIVQEQISRTVSDYGQAVEQAGLFRTGIIPQARQSLEATRAAYLVNKVDFLNLVRAQINLYNFETQYWRAATRAYQALASLEAAVGEDVNDG